jgi:DNA-binding transcriptional regulator YdaS (Cro superfamily)
MSQKPNHADAIQSLGGPSSVARLRGRTPWAISKWVRDGVPPNEVLWLAAATGWQFTPHQIDPKLYPNADDGLPRANGTEQAAA